MTDADCPKMTPGPDTFEKYRPGRSYTLNKLKTTPTPNKNGSYGIKRGGFVCYILGSVCHIFSLDFNRLLCHTDPHCMAYFRGILFANMGRGGGQNYFHYIPPPPSPHFWPKRYFQGRGVGVYILRPHTAGIL